MFTVCGDVTGGRTKDFPVVEICDAAGNCWNEVLDPMKDIIRENSKTELMKGEKYSWDISTRNFVTHRDSVKIIATGDDGLAVCDLHVDFIPVSDDDPPKYVDLPCAQPYLCEPDQYSNALIVYTCQEWEGKTDVNLFTGLETLISSIPVDVVDLMIILEADVDLDLQLYEGSDNTGHCIAGYGCIPCDEYPGCKDGLVPICPSGDLPECASEEDAMLYRETFDDSFPEDAECVQELKVGAPPCLPDWPTWSPTTTPSVSPTVSPTVDPTVSPTVGPTRTPSISPTTEEPTLPPSVSPTVDPTVGPTRSPSRTPSAAPTTEEPTQPPTKYPTTALPTVDPTVAPSHGPTRTPSRTPSQTPTLRPTSCDELEAEYEAALGDYDAAVTNCDAVEQEMKILRGECMYGLTCPRCGPAPAFGLAAATEENLVGVIPVDMDAFRAAGYTGGDELVYFNNEIYVVVGENSYERTCVGYDPVGTKLCSDQKVCSNGNRYGTTEQVVATLEVAYSRADKFHPQCPEGCSSLPEFYAPIFEDYGVDINDYCVFEDKYYYIDPETGARASTCVGYGSLMDNCPANKLFCCGFDDRTGYKTYGWLGMQAKALSIAQNMATKTHPYCPSYASV